MMENIRTSIEAAAEETRTTAQNNSDTDDWTFVSPPPSHSSSPTSTGGLKIGESARFSSKDQSSSSLKRITSGSGALDALAPLEIAPISTPRIDFSLADEQQQSQNEDDVSVDGDDADDESDGMTEINLSDESTANHKTESKGSGGGGSAAKRIKFASPLCSSRDADEATKMFQLVYDRLTSNSTTPNGKTIDNSNSASSSSLSSSTLSTNITTQTEANTATQTKPSMRTQGTSVDQRPRESVWFIILILSICMSITIFLDAFGNLKSWRSRAELSDLNAKLQKILESSNRTFNFVYLDPSSHAYTELKLLDEEMVDCIRRENPNLEEIKQWLSSDTITQSGGPNAARPFKGLVCYENEVEWRKRFNKLKTEFHIDLGKILKQVRQQLTYEMLELHHPSLRFKLIINQLEYLNFVDQRRKDRALERLKAENFELSRRPTSAPATVQDANNDSNNNNNISNKAYQQTPNQRHHQHHHHQQARLTSNSLVSLESENLRLRRENEALRGSLAEKAGTIYVKQSLELERCERENNALRQFHHQVADEVSKGSKQLNLHITDFAAILNGADRDNQGARLDQENNFITLPLAQTRGYLMRLIEEMGVLMNKNKILQDEVRETRLLNALVVREAKSLIGEEEEDEIDEANVTHDATAPLSLIADATEPAEIVGQDEDKVNVSAVDQQQQQYQYLTPNSNQRHTRTSDNNCLTNRQVEDFKMNWLMKRAKLRDQLRGTSNRIIVKDPLPSYYSGQHQQQEEKIDPVDGSDYRKRLEKKWANTGDDDNRSQRQKQQKSGHKHHHHHHQHHDQMMNKHHENQDYIYERRKPYHKQQQLKQAHNNYQPYSRVEL